MRKRGPLIDGVRGFRIRAASGQDAPWRAISGFRDILVQDFLAVDVDVVWLVVDQELSRLRAALPWMQTGLPLV
ncbi:HepT-like ribonuclease domain-containing protein [Thauera sp. JM12B12]|uniref:HepT-like ribonuclease domain-containing protein n=1 Tax=Thauera sp. JM12B12 TaxID=3142262 RepID=UPI0031F460FA